MKLKNIDRLLLYREVNDRVWTLEELQAKYGVDPDGTIFYFGVNQANVNSFKKTGLALNPTAQTFFAALQKSVAASPDDEKTFVLGVEPLEEANTYPFVTAHIDMLRALATELDDIQSQLLDQGKRLNIVIRYASEMNDPGQVQGKNDASGYVPTFLQVRLVFKDAAPRILFSFSPAVRADLPAEHTTGGHWPGEQYVDIIGGTWYIGEQSQQSQSLVNMRTYFSNFHRFNKPFALDEMGGCTTPMGGNDAMLQTMLHELESFQIQDISFKYVNIFLASKYGNDATLKFLENSSPTLS